MSLLRKWSQWDSGVSPWLQNVQSGLTRQPMSLQKQCFKDQQICLIAGILLPRAHRISSFHVWWSCFYANGNALRQSRFHCRYTIMQSTRFAIHGAAKALSGQYTVRKTKRASLAEFPALKTPIQMIPQSGHGTRLSSWRQVSTEGKLNMILSCWRTKGSFWTSTAHDPNLEGARHRVDHGWRFCGQVDVDTSALWEPSLQRTLRHRMHQSGANTQPLCCCHAFNPAVFLAVLSPTPPPNVSQNTSILILWEDIKLSPQTVLISRSQSRIHASLFVTEKLPTKGSLSLNSEQLALWVNISGFGQCSYTPTGWAKSPL